MPPISVRAIIALAGTLFLVASQMDRLALFAPKRADRLAVHR